MYAVMREPFVVVGAFQVTTARSPRATAVTAVGAVGTPTVTALVGLEAGPEPCLVTAVTRNRYVFPLTSPGTTSLVVAALTVSRLPGPTSRRRASRRSR